MWAIWKSVLAPLFMHKGHICRWGNIIRERQLRVLLTRNAVIRELAGANLVQETQVRKIKPAENAESNFSRFYRSLGEQASASVTTGVGLTEIAGELLVFDCPIVTTSRWHFYTLWRQAHRLVCAGRNAGRAVQQVRTVKLDASSKEGFCSDTLSFPSTAITSRSPFPSTPTPRTRID